MAKKQSFGDKVGKSSSGEKKKYIKLIRSYRSKKGSLKFSEMILGIDSDKSPENVINELIK